ncbi:Mevalonate kinase [Orbilia brochopaga]|uniref:mevalonate kinase n=1 Tax=Orbilia brochopaga TaxID=3140254 RepID=A0AAV9U2Y7_9PEZI
MTRDEDTLSMPSQAARAMSDRDLLNIASPARKRAESEVSRYYDAQEPAIGTDSELLDGDVDPLHTVPDNAHSNGVGARPSSMGGEGYRSTASMTSPPTAPSSFLPSLQRRDSRGRGREPTRKSSLSTPSGPFAFQYHPRRHSSNTMPTTARSPIAQEFQPKESTSVASEHLNNSAPPFAPPAMKSMSPHGRARSTSRTRRLSYMKTTEPELPDFMVSAPAKVIMYGEHAVVHGKAAIAAALSLRSYLHVQHLPRDNRTVTLHFADIKLNHTWDIESLPWDFFNSPSKKRLHFDTVSSLDPDLLEALEPYLSPIDNKYRAAATAFLYIYLCLGSKHSPAAIFTLRSTIPIGAGLGSSASITVCLSAALHLQSGMIIHPSAKLFEEECARQLKRINDWAFVGEMCIHGNPSGVDNTVATGGKAVLFRRGDYSKPPEVKRLEHFPELPLMLVNTNQPRRTADLVGAVHGLRNAHPTTCGLMLDAIDNVTAEAMMLLDNKHFRPDDSHLTRLGELVRINHGLLVSLGVSHPKLERVRQIVDGSGIGWTKLTGAGGGGCAFSILKPGGPVEEAKKIAVEETLREEGMVTYEATLGGDGVGVLWPAMAGRGDERWAITKEMFLEAEGSDGIEGLVGVRTLGTGRLGWGFWREWLPEEA